MCTYILSSPHSLYLFIQLDAPGSVVAELYCLTAGRLLFVWSLHVFFVFIQVSWVVDVLISIHRLETLNCNTSAFICVRFIPIKSSSLPSTHHSMENQMNEHARL